MKIHEYQAKAILAKHGVPVPQGEVIFKSEDAAGAADRLGGGTVVVKAQIHAGGRGKGGGVKVVKGPAEAQATAAKILGMNLVTHQTGPSGQIVQRVLIEQGLKIQRELYLGIVLDRASERLVLMVSPEGGVEIEKVAEETPEKIFKEFIHPGIGLSAYQTRKLAFALGLQGTQVASATKMMMALYKAFVATDASLLEINPLIVTESGELLALDAKMSFDDNALFRHPDFKELRDIERRGPARSRSLEVQPELHQARRHDRLHGERRRPRDGDDGHHQAGGRRAGELPRRRRRRQRRADQERVPHPDGGQGGEGRPDQHLRRHPALRHPRRRGDCRGHGAGRAGPDRDPDGRHQRREGQADAEGERAQLRDRGRHERSGPQGCRGGEAANGRTDR